MPLRLFTESSSGLRNLQLIDQSDWIVIRGIRIPDVKYQLSYGR